MKTQDEPKVEHDDVAAWNDMVSRVLRWQEADIRSRDSVTHWAANQQAERTARHELRAWRPPDGSKTVYEPLKWLPHVGADVVLKTRAQLVEDLRAMRENIQLAFNDAAHWNRLHPDAEPINPDPDGKLREMADQIDQMLRGNAAAIDLEPGEVELLARVAEFLRTVPEVQVIRDDIKTIERNGVVIWTRPKGDQS